MIRARWSAGLLAGAAVFLAGANAQDEAAPNGGFAVVCPVTGMIDDGIAVVVKRAIREAQDAEALIFEVDTPGGRVDSAVDITEAILEAPCRTIAYVNGMGAISAGALIAFACKDITMAPGSNMGAATPVMPTPEGNMPLGEKERSYVRARFRALAEANGHNAAIAEAMVDEDIELRLYVDAGGKRTIYSKETGRPVSSGKGDELADKAVDEAFRQLEDETGLPLDPLKELAKEALRQFDKTAADEEEVAEHTPEELISRNLDNLPPGSDVLILPKGKLLTLTPREAERFGVIPTTCKTVEEALRFYELGGVEIRRIEMTWAEKTFRFLTNPMVAGLLFLLGVGGLYFEVKTPGFGIPGIIGLTCLALFFGARAVLGLTDWIDLLLVAVGVSLILAEIFVIPGFGLAGVAGVICLLIGLYLSLVRVPIPEFSWDYDRTREAGQTMLLAGTLFIAFVYAVYKFFPKLPLYGRLVLTHAQVVDAGYVVQTAEEEQGTIGLRGVAASVLRPAGRGRFGDKTLDVVSRSDYIEKGTPIVIVRVEGNRHVVDPIQEEFK